MGELCFHFSKRQPDWLERVDLFAGTSTGGILSLGLASGLKPRELKQLYLDRGHEVFGDTFLDAVKDLGRLAARNIPQRI